MNTIVFLFLIHSHFQAIEQIATTDTNPSAAHDALVNLALDDIQAGRYPAWMAGRGLAEATREDVETAARAIEEGVQ